MYMLPGIPRFGISLHKDLRLLEFVRTVLPEFDIICCQEVFYTLNNRKQQLIHLAQMAGFPYHATSSKPSLFFQSVTDSGLLTLSRFPIVKSEFEAYPYGVFSDSISRKGVLFTHIKIKDTDLLLFNTHMQASYISTDLEEVKASITSREVQFELLRDFINVKLDLFRDEHLREPSLVMLCGDLNVDSKRNSQLMQELKRDFEAKGTILELKD